VRFSYRVFRVFGVDVRVHVTFVFIVAYFAVVWGALRKPGGGWGALYGVLLVILLFALVVIHELTHARVAQHYGIKVTSITLLPIGGLANMEEIPEEPRKELVISVAGPLSNLVLGGIMVAILPLIVNWSTLTASQVSNLIFQRSFLGAYMYVLVSNLFLGVFNLLPAFPMDGGRVFRAVLAFRLGRPRATRVAVFVGQGLAIAMAIAGLFFGGGILLVLVAIFIFIGAQAEGAQDPVQRVLASVRVKQVVRPGVHVARPGQSLGELAARLFHSYQEDFPVVGGRGDVEGILTRDRLIAMLGQHGVDYPVAEAMRTDFPTIGLEDRVAYALEEMRAGHFKAVPILDDGRLAGMLSMEDISEVYSLLSAGGEDILRRVSSVGPPSRRTHGGKAYAPESEADAAQES
jgi:Zn-dependent protease/predicted transcriptional regulator